jgi:hypothetical protein
MAILNYTTKISADKTALEIQKLLIKAKAQAITTAYDDGGVLSSLSFRIMTPYGYVSFRLPANLQGVFKTLSRNDKVPRRLKTKEQAARVAWRILKDWVEAQLAIVEAEQADLLEVFLPYAENSEGETVYQHAKRSKFLGLTHDKK